MKNQLKLFMGILFIPCIALATNNNQFPASLESLTDTTVTLTTTRPAQSGEYYGASCSPYTGKEDAGVFTVHTSITVPNLTKDVQYTCRINIYPSSTGGQIQGISQDVIFIAGDLSSIQMPTPPATSENQKPTITNVKYAIDTNVPEIGTKITFTATVTEPDHDNYKLKFWICKYDGSICYNAMNGAKEEWTYENQFRWIAPSGGNYQLKVIIIDGKHADERDAFGDHEYNLNFVVYGKPTTTDKPDFAITQSKPPAGYEDEVLTSSIEINPFPDTNINTLAGKAAAELYRRAVIGGYPNGQFKGDKSVNRAEAAKFLLLARFGSVSDISNHDQFWDVLDNQWYTKFVLTAASKGIINGYSDGSFRPADRVNTAEFLKMLTLTFELLENQTYSYSDVSSSSWYAQYAGTATKYNLFPNRASRLLPLTELSREDVAVAIYQYLSNK